LFTILIVVLAVPATRGHAQADRAPTPAAAESDTMARGGPRADAARAGIARNAPDATARSVHAVAAPPFVQAASRERGRTMMLVGGVVFLGGLLIGDDVGTAIAVTGLAIGVWGFYQLIR
jgi:hypothetical protein